MPTRRAAALLAFLTLAPSARAEPYDAPLAAQHPDAPAPAAPSLAGDASALPAPRLLTLSNGLRVVLAPDPLLTTTRFELRVGVGSSDAPPGYHGLTHVLEHLLYAGTPEVTLRDYTARLRAMDAADFNGTTGTDDTRYVATVPEAEAPPLLWLEANRFARAPGQWSARSLEHARRIVLLEAHQRQVGNALVEFHARAREALYPPGHPYRAMLETDDALDAVSLADVQWCWQRFYTPTRMTLALVGGALPASLEPQLEQLFGALPVPPPVPAAAAPVLAPMPAPAQLEVRRPVMRELAMLAWHTPAFLAEGDAALDVLAVLLGTSLPGSLRERMTRDADGGADVQVRQQSLQLGSLFVIEAMGPVGSAVEMAAALREQLASERVTALVRNEFTLAQTRWRDLTAQRRFHPAARASLLTHYAALRNTADGEALDRARYERLTVDEVLAALRSLRTTPPTVALLRSGRPQ